MVASSSHVTPAGSFARTPSCTGLPRDIVTPLAGLSDRSYRSSKQRLLPRFDGRLGGRHPVDGLLKRLCHHDGRVARRRRIVRHGQLPASEKCGSHQSSDCHLRPSLPRDCAWTFHVCLLRKSAVVPHAATARPCRTAASL